MLRTIAHRKKELLSEGVFELIIMRHLDPTPPLDLQLHEVVDFLTFTPGFVLDQKNQSQEWESSAG